MELASSTLAIPSSSTFYRSVIPPSSSAHTTTSISSAVLHLSLSASPAAVKAGSPTSSHIPRAKFEKFDGIPSDSTDEPSSPSPLLEQEYFEVEEEDSDLPTDLIDAVRQSSRASGEFVNSGGMRAIVELLIPQLQFLDAEGAQAEMWQLSRIFLETLMEEMGNLRVKAIFPDTGAAALLKYQWQDAAFGFASLSDRKPVDNEDEVVVMLLPDYQMLEYVERIASNLSADPPRPLIMWNPRLVSEDVGVGFNVRKLRRIFLSTFTPVYSMKRLPSGAVFRCYPGMWKVFYDDKERPNRYRLAKAQSVRPDASDLEVIFGDLAEKSDDGPSLLDKVGGVFSSLSRFMKAIS